MFNYYLIAKLDDIIHTFLPISSLFLTFSIIGYIVSFVLQVMSEGDSDEFSNQVKIIKLFLRRVVLCSAIAYTFLSLLPNTKQLAFIIVAPQIVENDAVKDTVKNIPELTQLGTEYLKELLKDKVEEIKK